MSMSEMGGRRGPRSWSVAAWLCTAAKCVAVMAGVWISGNVVSPSPVRAEADTLKQGDVSILAYEALEPYNRYWYFYSGATTCGGRPCNRFLYNSYEAFTVPRIGNEEATMPDVFLSSTGLRGEVGVFDNLTVSADTQLVYRSPTVYSATVLGDSHLGMRWRFSDGPVLISFGGAVKLPGNYVPTEFASPGGGQPDVEFKTLLGGLAFRRKLYYDFSFGYRVRFPYPNPAFVSYSRADGSAMGSPCNGTMTNNTCTLAVTGPSDESFMDLSIGYFTSRSLMLFVTLNGVNGAKGRQIDDYFLASQLKGDPEYLVEGDVGNLLSDLEEDYLRVGLGAMLKPMPALTVYANYSYVVIGRNIPAFYLVNDVLPVGALSFGLEYTFQAWGKPAKAEEDKMGRRYTDLRDHALASRLP